MKRLVWLAVAVFAVPLFAQQPANDFQIFAYFSNPGLTYSESYGTTIDGGFGAGVSKFVTPHISAELSISAQGWWEYQPGPIHLGDPVIRYKHTAYPISLDGQYHFFNESRWKPYLGLGVRYVDANARFRNLSPRVSAEINGGVEFMMTPHVSLRFDGKQAIRSNDAPGYDPWTRTSIGVGWHF